MRANQPARDRPGRRNSVSRAAVQRVEG
jgi:hypothetical protein